MQILRISRGTKVVVEVVLHWFGQMTLWCKPELQEMAFKAFGGDLAQRLLGVGVIWPKDYLVLIQPWHQGVLWPAHPNTNHPPKL